MLEIDCPRCESRMGGLLLDYFRLRSDRRRCSSCGAELEIANGFVCFGICGLISASAFVVFLLISATCFSGGGIWAGSLTAIFFCWGLMPIMVRGIGRWRISSGGSAASIGVRRWSGIAHISRWVFIVAVLFTAVIIVLRYRGLLQDVSGTESGLYATEDFLSAVGLTAVVGFGIAGVSLIVYIFAMFMRRRARMAEKRVELEGSI